MRQHFTYGVSEPECRALLLQAKTHTSSKIAKLSDKKELEQFGIYNGWKTKFVFPHNEIGPPPAPATKWCFATSPMPNPEKSGWYAVAFSDRRTNYISGFPNDCIWGVGPAQVGKGKLAIDANVSMGEVIAGVLKGTEGREWTATPKPDDHWSIFVKRILAVALRDQWKYPVQRIGVSNSERIRQIVFPIATFACMGTNAGQKMSAFTGATPHFSPSLNNDDVDDQLMGIRKWIESIGGESDRLPPSGGGDGGDYGKRPLRAPSILYLGTIGPRRLSEMSPKNLDLD